MSDWYRRGREEDRIGRWREPRSFEDRRAAERAPEERYDEHESGGLIGVNPALNRVTEGEADRVWGSEPGAGAHRGKGPRSYVRADERIREDVNDRLTEDSWLDASEIEVEAAGGEVTLNGAVQTRQDKRRAEDLAEQVRGVKHVQNNLRVQPRPQAPPAGAGQSVPPAG